MKRNEKKGPTNFWNHPKIFIAIFTIIPIFLFAVNDMGYWEVIQRNFGLNNSWYAIAINFKTDHGGGTYGYLFPNSAFILFVITVICLNVTYYLLLKGKNS